jgi:ankyrin repeat protein
MIEILNLAEAILNKNHHQLKKLIREISADDCFTKDIYYDSPISHWMYTGDTAMHLLCAAKQIEGINQLIDNGCGINTNNNRRKSTPLHYACEYIFEQDVYDQEQQEKLILKLIELGANINAEDKNGNTPLMTAIRSRALKAVQVLNTLNPILKTEHLDKIERMLNSNTGRGGVSCEQAKANLIEIKKLMVPYFS